LENELKETILGRIELNELIILKDMFYKYPLQGDIITVFKLMAIGHLLDTLVDGVITEEILTSAKNVFGHTIYNRPLEDMPEYINSDDIYLKTVAEWRLKIGR
jgi:hypothetical protein